MNILLFAEIAEIAGTHSVWLDIEDPITVGQIKKKLVERFPDKGLEEKLRFCFGAVNQTYCSDDTMVSRSDVIALIPPVSGG
jgi:molybdopterin converting factor subunit 1